MPLEKVLLSSLKVSIAASPRQPTRRHLRQTLGGEQSGGTS